MYASYAPDDEDGTGGGGGGGAIEADSRAKKIEFASEPRINDTQMEFKVRNEGWTTLEAMTEIGSYKIEDASGKVVWGPVNFRNSIPIESTRTYPVSLDIKNVPGPVEPLPDGDYTARIEVGEAARRSLKFKKKMGELLPR
jgi:hypothetical protein